LVPGLRGDAELPAQFEPSAPQLVADPQSEAFRPPTEDSFHGIPHLLPKRRGTVTYLSGRSVNYVSDRLEFSRATVAPAPAEKPPRGKPSLRLVSNPPRKTFPDLSARISVLTLKWHCRRSRCPVADAGEEK